MDIEAELAKIDKQEEKLEESKRDIEDAKGELKVSFCRCCASSFAPRLTRAHNKDIKLDAELEALKHQEERVLERGRGDLEDTKRSLVTLRFQANQPEAQPKDPPGPPMGGSQNQRSAQ